MIRPFQPKGKLHLLSLSFLLIALPSSAWTTEIIAISSKSQAELGTGYSSSQERFKAKCLTGKKVEVGLNQANLEFSQSISTDQVAEEFGFKAGARARFGIVESSAAAKFLSQSKSDSFSISAVYSGDYQFKNAVISEPVLTAVGKDAVLHDEVVEVCGDHYVQELVKGAKIFFLIRIDFSSEDDKRQFEAEFSVDGGLWSAAGSVKNASNRFSTRTKIKVSALQVGGKVEELSAIFGSNSDDPLKLVECSMGSFDQCSYVLQNAIRYATQDLRKQFNETTDPEARAATLSYITRPVQEAGVRNAHPPQLKSAILESREALTQFLDHDYSFMLRADRFLKGGSRRMSPRQRKVLEEAREKLNKNKLRILEAAQECWEVPGEKCTTKVALMSAGEPMGLFQISDEIFNLKSESFSQFCDDGLSPQAPHSIKETIESVIEITRRRRPELFSDYSSLDLCSVVGNYWDGLTTVDLTRDSDTKHSISDLRPILAFSKMEELIAKEHQIKDLSVIELISTDLLPRLKKIDLSQNKITDPKGLEKLKTLTHVILQDNSIRNPSELTNLKNLKQLDLRNNGVEQTHFEGNPTLKILFEDYSKKGQFSTIHRPLHMRTLDSTLTELDRGERILVTAATSPQGETSIHPSNSIYHLGSDSTEEIKSLLHPRMGHSAFSMPLNTSVLLFGGWEDSSPVIYHQEDKTITSLNSGTWNDRYGHTSTALADGRLLITGGFRQESLVHPHLLMGEKDSFINLMQGMINLGPSSAAFIFDPSTYQTTELPMGLTAGRAFHSATLLKDGRVLIAGGFGERGSLRSAEIYDPSKNKIEYINETYLREGRDLHQATLLQDGKVLITGGFNGLNPDPVDLVEWYDPALNKFISSSARMSSPRALHSATSLSDGTVLITGGYKTLTRRPPYTIAERHTAHCIAELFVPNKDGLDEFYRLESRQSLTCGKHSTIHLKPGTVFLMGSHGAELFTYAY